MRLFSFLSLKTAILAGGVVATLGTGIVAASAAYTEDDFGQAVKAEVAACKATAARLNEHGIGQCVSSFARANHPTDAASPEPSESPEATESPKVRPTETPEADDAAAAGDQEARPSPRPTTSITTITGEHSGRRS